MSDEETQKLDVELSISNRCYVRPALWNSTQPLIAEDERRENNTTPQIEQFVMCQPLAYLFAFLFLDMIWEVMFGLAFDQINVDESM